MQQAADQTTFLLGLMKTGGQVRPFLADQSPGQYPACKGRADRGQTDIQCHVVEDMDCHRALD